MKEKCVTLQPTLADFWATPGRGDCVSLLSRGSGRRTKWREKEWEKKREGSAGAGEETTLGHLSNKKREVKEKEGGEKPF